MTDQYESRTCTAHLRKNDSL